MKQRLGNGAEDEGEPVVEGRWMDAAKGEDRTGSGEVDWDVGTPFSLGNDKFFRLIRRLFAGER